MNKIIVPIIALFTLCQVKAEVPLPKLVVWLTVDELRTDYLETLLPEMPDDGMAKLVNEGLYYRQMRSPLERTNSVSAMAMLHTGHLPDKSYITERFPTTVHKNGRTRTLSIFYDEHYIGYATTERFSPKVLNVATVGDRLKEQSAGRSRVYSFGISPEEALAAGGHKANGVFWIDNFYGKWASSTYFKETIPWFVEKYNNSTEGLGSNLDSYKWTTLYNSPEKYQKLPYSAGETGKLSQSFSKAAGADGVARYKLTPLVNEEVKRVVDTFVKYSDLGQKQEPDLVNIHLSVGVEETDNRLTATTDAYYRVDRVIAALMKEINAKVGADKVMYVLSGSGYCKDEGAEESAVGTFYLDRCKALMNMYLIPTFGQGNWVEEVSERGEVFLNVKEAKKKNIELEKLESYAADFLMEFSGVHDVVTNSQLRRGQVSPLQHDFYQRAVEKNRPQLLFTLSQGWVYGTQNGVKPSKWAKEYGAPIAAPLILSYSHHLTGKVNRPLSIQAVSSAIAYVLRIRPPNPTEDIPEEVVAQM